MKVLIPMADYGHDPTGELHIFHFWRSVMVLQELSRADVIIKKYSETAVAYAVFKEEGLKVHFATETGISPKCDERMMAGISGKLLVGLST